MHIEDLHGVPDIDRRSKRSHGPDINWSHSKPDMRPDAVHERRRAAVTERTPRWKLMESSESNRVTF